MKYVIHLKSVCTTLLVASGLLFFVYLFNMVMVVGDTKKINSEIEIATSKISEQTSQYYAVQTTIEDAGTINNEYVIPESRVYVDMDEQTSNVVVTAR